MPIEAPVSVPAERKPPVTVPAKERKAYTSKMREESLQAMRQRGKEVLSAPISAPITTSTPVNTQPARPPSSGSAPYTPSTNLKYGVTRPPALMYRAELGQKWRPTREFYLEKLEEMRKKRLAKMPVEEAVKPAIPPTIKFGAYEVKTEHVAIGALALIIIAVVILT